MFTVKATYRGETRKFTFPESTFFPSFDQLYNQLYRVFPISQNYYLSKLLFSPNSSKPSRILIGKEVRSASEYADCLAPFQQRTWPDALLRFSVYDETPHKVPSVVPSDISHTWSSAGDSDRSERNDDPFPELAGCVRFTSADIDIQPIPPPPPPPMSLFHIPPPPIIYSSSPRAFTQAPMDVDPTPTDRVHEGHNVHPFPFAQHQEPQPKSATPKPCSCVSGKAQIEALLSSFKGDLEHIIANTFGSPQSAEPESLPPQLHTMLPTPAPFAPVPQLPCLYKYCTSCARIFQGPWYSCDRCKMVLCPGCHEGGRTLSCFANMGLSHEMKKETCAACPKSASSPPGPQFQFNPEASFFNPMLSGRPLPTVGTAGRPAPPMAILSGPFPPFAPAAIPSWPPYNPSFTPVVPFVPPSSSGGSPVPLPDQLPPVPPTLPPFNPPPPEPFNDPSYMHYERARGPPSPPPISTPLPPPPPPPVIHRGIACDVCKDTIEGVRHKCLDCPDYDLCTKCIGAGSAERHNPFHEFLDIKEPGRVIVHTVYSGDGERETMPNNFARAQPQQRDVEDDELAVHYATCDLCDSRIQGDRYKCVHCPDFDTCSSCFSITPDQHPTHAFVKIVKPMDYIRRENVAPVRHFATCNVCGMGINNVRYKCMHPECPDFDLCEGCEAHPIPTHPSNHPLLKMKSVDTIVPTVYRVGKTTLIESDTLDRGRSPLTRGTTPLRSRSGSFNRGYMRNPSARSGSASPSPPTVVATHAPFYFHSSGFSRSRSPVHRHASESIVSRSHLPPRCRSPMIIPGALRSPTPVFGSLSHEDDVVDMRPICRYSPSRSRSPRFRSPMMTPQPNYLYSRSPSRSRSPRLSEDHVHMRGRDASPILSYYGGDQPRSHYRSLSRESVRRSLDTSPSPPIPHATLWRNPGFIAASPSPRLSPSPSPQSTPPQPNVLPPQFPPYTFSERSGSPSPFPMIAPTVPHHRSLNPRPSSPEWRPIFDSPVPAMATHTPVEPVIVNPNNSVAMEPMSPVEQAQTETTSPDESSTSQFKLPPLALDPSSDLFREFWPRVAQELRHLMLHDPQQEGTSIGNSQLQPSQGSTSTAVDTRSNTEDGNTVTESPLTGEALLHRPPPASSQFEMLQSNTAPVTSLNRSLAALLSGYQSSFPVVLPPVVELVSTVSDKKDVNLPIAVRIPKLEAPLSAEFISDITVPDGQVFPPGAEFVKSWRMLNDSGRDWPESTELVFVAGESLIRDQGMTQTVKVGSVKAGAEVDLWTGELKAPDTPGRYVGYWRLKDGQGNLFGNSIWIDINVQELSHQSERSSDESLAASSIIMPRSAPAQSAAPSVDVAQDTVNASSSMTSPITVISIPPTSTAVSDDGSDDSSVSLISVPSSEDDDDVAWEDSRSHLSPVEHARSAMDYVVLYDDNSSDED